jgi:hypothetical protein
MDFDSSRVRRGEALASASAVALLVLMFVLHWYGPRADGARPVASTTGWDAFTLWRWLALGTILTALALVFFQAARRAPALPAALSVIVTALGLLTALWLGIRVLFDHPPGQQIGAMLALLCAIGMFAGGYLSLREEGIPERDQPGAIPTVKLE